MRRFFLYSFAVALFAVTCALGLAVAFHGETPSLEMTQSKKVARTGVEASPERIFAVIGDFREWRKWSAHEKPDSAVRRSYGGSSMGQGAVYEWEGESDVGKGRAEIVEFNAPRKMSVVFDLAAPVRGRLQVDFIVEPTSGAAKVEVATSGSSAIVNYVMDTFLNDAPLRITCVVEASPKPICKFFSQQPLP